MPAHQPSRQKGFTLVELVVVVLILGILAGVAAPRFIDVSGDGQEVAARTSVNTIADQIELQTAREGRLPLFVLPEWFQGNRLPVNPYNQAGVRRLQVVQISGQEHPTNKLLTPDSQGAFWYNNATGAVRVRVPRQRSNLETLALYNRVNYDSVAELNAVTSIVNDGAVTGAFGTPATANPGN